MLWLGCYLNYFLVVADACERFNHKCAFVQVRAVHQRRFTHTTLIKTLKINQRHAMKMARQKFPCVLRNILIIISNTTGLSFVLKRIRIGPLAATIVAIFYLLVLYLFAIPKTHKYFPFSSCSETLLRPTCQRLLLLAGFDTLTYRKDYDRPPTLVGHHTIHVFQIKRPNLKHA